MELKPKNQQKIIKLMEKGVEVRNPLTVDIGDDVQVAQISGNGVKIYPGCRIYGGMTVISSGVYIGREGPVTIEDCQIGPEVELKAGYFNGAVGIGTESPARTLHVNGTARITSNTEVSGTIKLSGVGDEVCSTATAGTMRYDPTLGVLEICRP